MSNYDLQYNALVHKILAEGKDQEAEDVRARWADSTPATAKNILNFQFQFDWDRDGVPLLTTKHVAWKTAIKELLWIWQQKSNKVQDLRDVGVHIWDKWEFQEGDWKGTIGPAYGYQLGKKCRNVGGVMLDQVDYLLYTLSNSPGARRSITTLWDADDLDTMALTPCIWNTQWIRWDGRLHLTVTSRSNDICVGNPFNIFQYYVLQRMVSQVTNIPLGTFTFNITDAHIYHRHIGEVEKQMAEEMYAAPELVIDPTIKNFYDFRIEHFQLNGHYKSKKYEFEVAE